MRKTIVMLVIRSFVWRYTKKKVLLKYLKI